MRKTVMGLLAVVLVSACQENEALKQGEFTGNQSVYALLPGSTYAINGNVTFKERTDGSVQITVALYGTEGDIKCPVHLHLGNISTTGASVAALLNPVLGKTGISETRLCKLADESTVSYKQLIDMTACVKVHLSDVGPDKDIVLAAGNIGASVKDNSGGRLRVSLCKSE